MMTSSNGNIFRVTGPLCGEFTGPSEFPTQRPVTRSFAVYFDLRLNKRLCKQSWGWWFETLLCPLWRHSNGRRVASDTLVIISAHNGLLLDRRQAITWSSAAYMCQWTGSSLVQIMACRYLNQSCVIINWTLRNKLQWSFNPNSNIFNQQKHLKCRPQNGANCVSVSMY